MNSSLLVLVMSLVAGRVRSIVDDKVVEGWYDFVVALTGVDLVVDRMVTAAARGSQEAGDAWL